LQPRINHDGEERKKMPLKGGGKYDYEAMKQRERLKAAGVILIVIGGKKGDGFSGQATRPILEAMPQVLRDVADQMDLDLAKLKAGMRDH
jgi:hypothetical protein